MGMRFFLPAFIVSVVMCLSPLSGLARDPDHLEDVLGGFETKTGGQPSPDAVLEGFAKEENATQGIPDIMEGFASDLPEQKAPGTGFKPAWLSLGGSLSLGSVYNLSHQAPQTGETDWRGVSKLRSELQLEATAKYFEDWQAHLSAKAVYDAIYGLRGRDNYTNSVLDAYEEEVELGETYVLGRLSPGLDLKIGRQIVVWGKSDNIRVTDVLNPLDLREPGLTDIEDLRLPVTMTKLDAYFGDWNLSGLAIHEIRFDKTPSFGHDFFPGQAPSPPKDRPGSDPGNTEWALSLSGIFSGWDLDLSYARIFNDQPHLKNLAPGPDPEIRKRHARLHMFGIAANLALGNWLVKAEAALLDGLESFNCPGEEFARLDGLIGVEYSGFKETSISLELADRHLLNYQDELGSGPDRVQEDELQAVVRCTRDFWNDTLTLTCLASVFGPADADGAFERLSLEYDLSDRVEILAGIVLYQSGDRPSMQNIGDNDRLFLEWTYRF